MNVTDKAKITAPALASFLLRLAARGDREYSLIREMTEEYGDYAARKGGSEARRWFWRQTLRSLPSIAADSAVSQASMLNNYFKIALRNMRRRKGYSLINILGLALGMTCFIALMMYVDFERSYDSFNEKSDRIYRVWMYWEGWSIRGLHNFAYSNGAIVPAMKREYPEVEAAVRTQPTSYSLEYDDRAFVERGMYAGEDFLGIFTFPLLKGDPGTALVEPFTIVISRKLAQKLFGPEDPIGKVLEGSSGRDFTVTGVFGEVPDNSHLDFEFLVSFSSLHSIRNDDIDNVWGILNYINYVLLKDGVSKDEFEAKLTALVDSNLPSEETVRTYHLQPVRDIHLSTDILDYSGRKSDSKYLHLLTAIAFLVLSIACVNYINMATSQASLRAKEVGIRKTAGAGRPELVRQFLGESFLLSLLALAVSLLAVYQLHPFLGRLFDQEIPLGTVFNPGSIATLAAIMIAAGLLSGAYPAFLLSSMRPASAIKSNMRTSRPGKRLRLRNVLVVSQFVVTIVLITAAVVIEKQLDFIRHTDLGYDRENVVAVRLWGDSDPQSWDALKDDLRRNPEIISAAVSDKPPVRFSEVSQATFGGDTEDEEMTINQVCFFYVDEDFLDVYGMGIAEGRNFDHGNASDAEGGVLINETAARMLGEGSPLGRSFASGMVEDGRIIGVVKDFHYVGLQTEIGAVALVVRPQRARELSIRITGRDIEKTIAHINTTLASHIDNFALEYRFIDDLYESLHSSEARMGTVIITFSIIAITIAVIGLLGLISFIAAQKTREISIRKVLGASTTRIMYMLVKDFAVLVIISGVIALPAAYLIMDRWLENFAYRTGISFWVLMLSLLVTASVTALSVMLQVMKATRTDPAVALRSE